MQKVLAALKRIWAWGEPIGAAIAKKPKTWVAVIGVVCAVAGHSLPQDTVAKIATDIADIASQL